MNKSFCCCYYYYYYLYILLYIYILVTVLPHTWCLYLVPYLNIRTLLHLPALPLAVSYCTARACTKPRPLSTQKSLLHADVSYWTVRVQQRTHLFVRAKCEVLQLPETTSPCACALQPVSREDYKREACDRTRLFRTTYPT